jgi:hypothetical protein
MGIRPVATGHGGFAPQLSKFAHPSSTWGSGSARGQEAAAKRTCIEEEEWLLTD